MRIALEKIYEIDISYIKHLPGVHLSKNYYIHSSVGDFCLKKWPDYFEDAHLQLQYKIHNLNCEFIPRIRVSKNNSHCVMIDSKRYSLIDFIYHNNNALDYKCISEYAACLAKIHKSLRTIRVKTSANDISLSTMLLDEIDRFYSIIMKLPETIITEDNKIYLSQKRNEVNWLIKDIKFSGQQQIIHGDFNPHNILLKDMIVVGCIDFTNAQKSYTVFDIADALSYFAFRSYDELELEEDNIVLFLDAYYSLISELQSFKLSTIIAIIIVRIMNNVNSFEAHIKFLRLESNKKYFTKLILKLYNLMEVL